ncbi:hypothetical protein [Sphingomonas montanisoli]|nr:hypothetical protein [Sphingomonas montanisoli]
MRNVLTTSIVTFFLGGAVLIVAASAISDDRWNGGVAAQYDLAKALGR